MGAAGVGEASEGSEGRDKESDPGEEPSSDGRGGRFPWIRSGGGSIPRLSSGSGIGGVGSPAASRVEAVKKNKSKRCRFKWPFLIRVFPLSKEADYIPDFPKSHFMPFGEGVIMARGPA
jgi:hypothetical protein